MKIRNSHHRQLGLAFEHELTRFEIQADDGQRWEIVDSGNGLRVRCMGTENCANDLIAIYPEQANSIRLKGTEP